MKETKSEGWIAGAIIALATFARYQEWIDGETLKQIYTWVGLGYGVLRTGLKGVDKLAPKDDGTSIEDKLGKVIEEKVPGLLDKLIDKIK